MESAVERQEDQSPEIEQRETAFSSNDVRLSPRGWLVVVCVVAALLYGIPAAWERIEPFESEVDYRVPYRLSYDYWTIRRYCRRVAAEDKTLVLGDSAVWGHYVSKDQTLSHYLNELGGDDRFRNLGIDGIHPAAMAGLVQHYGQDITRGKVVVHCNLLWTASKRRDLSDQKESDFNHPKLVPQAYPRVPCYKESWSRRLGIVVGREVPFFGWVDHLRIAYFEELDIAAWTTEPPYANPIGELTLELPSPDEPPSTEPVADSWTNKGMRQVNFPWVPLDESLQWRSFHRAVEILQRRGNSVFVLVGPFNEHMLRQDSLEAYQNRKRSVEAWLEQQRIPHFVPAALPSEHYADASHPLADGYRLLAEQMLENESFRGFLAN
jgi:hypothetical protein